MGGCQSTPIVEAPLPPANPDCIHSAIGYLASDELEGRDVGTTGLQQAEGYILGRFMLLNLVPAGDNNTFVQAFPYKVTNRLGFISSTNEVQLHNVVAKIPGRGPDGDECIVLMAHYDHVGRGTNGRSTSSLVGEIHNGADDNASGTAALLELARIFSDKPHNNRTLVFMALTGEEEGDLGSNAWVKNPTIPLEKVKAVLNFDMVGRMKNNQVALVGYETSPAFKEIVRQLKNPNQVEIINIYPHGGTPDDLTTFLRAKIPGMEFWTGYHVDYHAPSDDIDKINFDGAAKIVDLSAQMVQLIDKTPARALAFSPFPTSTTRPTTIPSATQPAPRSIIGIRAAPRLVEGFYGVLIQTVSPNSPASSAGLLPGDILLQVNNRMIYSSRELSGILQSLAPNKAVPIKIQRGNTTFDLSITPVAEGE